MVAGGASMTQEGASRTRCATTAPSLIARVHPVTTSALAPLPGHHRPGNA